LFERLLRGLIFTAALVLAAWIPFKEMFPNTVAAPAAVKAAPGQAPSL
jgi:hypothetical protein